MARNIKLIIEWFKEFFSTCPLRKHFSKNDPPFIIIGHRGSPTVEVENTIPSFERAMQEGANGLEIDLCLTTDKQVIIWHDWNPNDTVALLRESGFEPFLKYTPSPPPIGSEFRRRISSLTLNEVRENFRYKEKNDGDVEAYIPTLAEVFEWTQKQPELKFFCLDIKTPDDESELALEILRQIKCFIEDYNPSFIVIIETYSRKIHDLMKKKYPGFNYSLDIEPHAGIVLDPAAHSAILAAHQLGNTFAIAMRPRKITIANFTTYRRIIKHDVKLLRRLRKDTDCKIQCLIGATVSKKKEMKCLIRIGVEGIQTDYPARLRKILNRYKRHIAK